MKQAMIEKQTSVREKTVMSSRLAIENKSQKFSIFSQTGN